MFTAISFVAVLISNVIPNVAGFLSYEPKDAVIVISGFIFGPLTCVFVSVLTSIIEMLTISSTGFYGLLMNVVSTCAFTVPAAWFYRKHHTLKGAVIGLGARDAEQAEKNKKSRKDSPLHLRPRRTPHP